MFKKYKNSGLATFVSVIGALFQYGGVLCLFSGLIPGALVCIPIGILLYFAGEKISFNKWVKLLQSKGLEEQIRTDANVAVQVYNANPGKNTLAYISSLNPQAGEQIAQSVNKK